MGQIQHQLRSHRGLRRRRLACTALSFEGHYGENRVTRVWQSTMTHIALEGRCFVLSACQYLLRRDCPKNHSPIQGDAPDTVLIEGGSVIISPLGDVLAGPLRGREGILTADLDLNEIARGKFDFDVVGHYARPDVFTLTVDERARKPVVTKA